MNEEIEIKGSLDTVGMKSVTHHGENEAGKKPEKKSFEGVLELIR